MTTINSPIINRRPRCSDKAIQLYWKSDPNNPLAPGTTFNIQDVNGNASNISGITGTGYTFNGLTNGTRYQFQIAPVVGGVVGTFQKFNNVQPGFRPGAPVNVKYDVAADGTLQISWSSNVFTGNSDISRNMITLVAADIYGNLLVKEPYIIRDANGKPDYSNTLVTKKATYAGDGVRYLQTPNLTYNYKALVQAINDIGYSSYGNFTKTLNASTPSKGLKLWLDPWESININTTTDQNGKKRIIKWTDKSQDALVANALIATAPGYDVNNGVLTFDGTQYMKLPDGCLPNSNVYSIFMYMEPKCTKTIDALSGGNSGVNSGLSIYTKSGNIYQDYNNFNLNGKFNVKGKPFLAEFSSNGQNVSTYINGNLICSVAKSDSRYANVSNIYIGAGLNLSNKFEGNIGDIIIYDRAVSELERYNLGQYVLARRNYSYAPVPVLNLNELASLLVWLDASNVDATLINDTTIAVDGDAIYQWLNQSTLNTESVKQTNPLRQPRKADCGLNNTDAVKFNGSNNQYFVSQSSSYPLDLFAVLHLDNQSNGTIANITSNINDITNYNELSYGNNGFINKNKNTNGNINIINTSNTVIQPNTMALVELSLSDNNYIIRKDGNEGGSSELYSLLTSNVELQIGGTSSEYIHEVLSFNKQLVFDERTQVEGYLAWKWGFQNTLANSHPYKNYGPNVISKYTTGGPHNFNPNVLGNLTLWIDANDNTNMTVNGSKVVSIKDKSPANSIISISNSNNVNKISSKIGNVITIKDTEQIRAKLPKAFNTSDYTIVEVYQVDGYSNVNVCGLGDSSNYSTTIKYENNSYNLYGNNAKTIKSNFTDSSNKYVIQTSIKHNTNDTNFGNLLITYINGMAGYHNFNSISSNINVANIDLKANIAEVLVFNKALNNDDRTTVEAYLGWKWNLPGVFPYYNPYYYDANVISSVQNLVLWYDANDMNTINWDTNNGNIITGWNDKSGVINNANTQISSNPPTITTIGNQYFASFQDSGMDSAYLRCSSNINLDHRLSYFIVGQYNNPNNNYYGSSTPSSQPELRTIFTASKDYELAGGNILSGAAFIVDSNISIVSTSLENGEDVIDPVIGKQITNSKYILELIKNDQYYKSYLNGIYIGEHTDVMGHTDFKAFYFGGHDDINTSAGNIAEVIAYNSTLNDDERQRVEAYLSTKYTIPIDSKNPYSLLNNNQTIDINYRRNKIIPSSPAITNALNQNTAPLSDGSIYSTYLAAPAPQALSNKFKLGNSYKFQFPFNNEQVLKKVSFYGTNVYDTSSNELPNGFYIYNCDINGTATNQPFYSCVSISKLDYNTNNQYGLYSFDMIVFSNLSTSNIFTLEMKCNTNFVISEIDFFTASKKKAPGGDGGGDYVDEDGGTAVPDEGTYYSY
jgi:hypothetical protein